MIKNDLTKGNIFHNLIRFSVPYLVSCFLQTFYGLADLFITGQFYGADTITAVSVGSQVMHMVTIIIVGFAMGTTVTVSYAMGAKDKRSAGKAIGNSLFLFAAIAIALTATMFFGMDGILRLLSVPKEALTETKDYLTVCTAGILFIVAYNVLSSIFRGLGDTRTPMYFVAVAGVINIGLDILFLGPLSMGAFGAALATVIAQALSVAAALIYTAKRVPELRLTKCDLLPSGKCLSELLKIGLPVAAQDGLIQIAFLVITVIANRRGVDAAAAVGIVEKIISFLFLVPSAMLSSVSTITSASIGGGMPERGQKTLTYAMVLCIGSGLIFTVICTAFAENILTLFAGNSPAVILFGSQYLRAYVIDCMIAGIHFCFSGYFCAYRKSWFAFVHNIASASLIRIPGSMLAATLYPATLFPMGLAAPLGSLFSVIICVIAYFILFRKKNRTAVC